MFVGVMAAFTVYWRHDYWRSLGSEDPGPRLAVLFGGPHQSQPSFFRAGVESGDRLFPITVRKRRVHVLASMVVTELVEVDIVDPEMGGWLPRYAEWAFLAETCTTEVVIGTQGTVARADSFWGIYRLHPRTAERLAAITGEGLAVAS